MVAHVRSFQKDDQAAVLALWRACNLVVPWNDPVLDIERKIARDTDLFLVAVEEGVLVATAMGGYEGHRGWVNYLAVDPQRRFLGLGRQLMEVLEGKLLVLGCPKINLQIREDNEAVMAFYRSLGYAVDPVVSMGKRLVRDQ